MSFDIEVMSFFFFPAKMMIIFHHWDFTDQDGDSRQTLKFRDLRMKYSWELTTRNNSFDHQTWQCWGFGG
jgi:hypothetical protein